MTARTAIVLRRLLLTLPALLAMTVFVFLIVRLVPGDPVRTMLGFRASPANVRVARMELGLDQPVPVQYVRWLAGLLHGDLGRDYVTRAPVGELISQRLPVTVELAALAMTLSLVAGILLGLLAVGPSRWVRGTMHGVVLAGIVLPDFWLGIMLVLLFAELLRVLPPLGYVPWDADPVEHLRSLVLPVVTLALGRTAYIARTTHGALQETLSLPYIVFLRARGLPERWIVMGHALRGASAPIVTTVGMQFGMLLGGTIIVEVLFGLPGMGSLVVRAVEERNYTVVQGCVLVIAVIFSLVNLAADLAVGWLDERAAESQAA